MLYIYNRNVYYHPFLVKGQSIFQYGDKITEMRELQQQGKIMIKMNFKFSIK
jgi:hypothetical protein